jgi:hypothetical protein
VRKLDRRVETRNRVNLVIIFDLLCDATVFAVAILKKLGSHSQRGPLSHQFSCQKEVVSSLPMVILVQCKPSREPCLSHRMGVWIQPKSTRSWSIAAITLLTVMRRHRHTQVGIIYSRLMWCALGLIEARRVKTPDIVVSTAVTHALLPSWGRSRGALIPSVSFRCLRWQVLALFVLFIYF